MTGKAKRIATPGRVAAGWQIAGAAAVAVGVGILTCVGWAIVVAGVFGIAFGVALEVS